MAAATHNSAQQAVLPEEREHMRGIIQAIESIAQQFSLPISDVYENVRIQIQQLEEQASIKQYISILAIKQVKDSLRMTRAKHAA